MEKDMTVKQIDRGVEQEAAKAKTLADCKRRLASLHREEVLMRTYGIFGKYPNAQKAHDKLVKLLEGRLKKNA